MSYSERAVSFDCAGEQLLGVVSLPSAGSDLGVLIVVGGPQYRVGSHRQFVHLARHLASAGFPVMRFDTRGMGDSSGVFPGFENIGLDIDCAVKALRLEVPSIRRVVLWGLCDAASAVMINAASMEGIASIVLLNPWVRTAETLATTEVKHYYHKRLLDPAFWRKLMSGRVAVISSLREYLGKLAQQLFQRKKSGHHESESGDFREKMVRGWKAFAGSSLLILSGRDLVAAEFKGFASSHPVLSQLCQQGGVISREFLEADHTFSGRKHCQDVEAATLAWLQTLRSEGGK